MELHASLSSEMPVSTSTNQTASKRWRTARLHDQTARTRDHAAEARDHAAESQTKSLLGDRETGDSYDPIVRVGGDEFLCGFSTMGLDASQRRIDDIRAAVAERSAGGSITVGLASLGPNETLEELTPDHRRAFRPE